MGDYYKDKRNKYDYHHYMNEMLYMYGEPIKTLREDLGIGVTTMTRMRKGCVRLTLPMCLCICQRTGIIFSEWANHSEWVKHLKELYDKQLEVGGLDRIPGVY